MTRAELDAQMRLVLQQLEVCSHVPAATRSGGSSSDEPVGGKRPPGDMGARVFAQLYGMPFHEEPVFGGYTHGRGEVRALERHLLLGPYPRSDEDRRKVLDAARAELKHLRGHTERPRFEGETHEQMIARMLDETIGVSPEDVATTAFRMSATLVRRYRRAAGRDPETSKPLPERVGRQRSTTGTGRFVPQDGAEERRARVRARAAAGMTIAQIALLEGVHRSTVERDLGRARAA